MRNALIVFLLVVMAGCQSVKQEHRVHEIPLYKDFHRIATYPYSLNKYDCSNKCFEYYKLLKKAGYETYILGVYRQGDPFAHAIIWIKDFGIVDPTWNWYHKIEGKSIGPIYDFYSDARNKVYGDIIEIFDEDALNDPKNLEEFNKYK
jgi:hypothetical protein